MASEVATAEMRTTLAAAQGGIFLMQNHPLMILGTSSFLNAQPDIHVIGSAQTPAHGFEKVSACRPDLIVFELSITGPYSFSDLKKLHRLHSSHDR